MDVSVRDMVADIEEHMVCEGMMEDDELDILNRVEDIRYMLTQGDDDDA